MAAFRAPNVQNGPFRVSLKTPLREAAALFSDANRVLIKKNELVFFFNVFIEAFGRYSERFSILCDVTAPISRALKEKRAVNLLSAKWRCFDV